MSKQVPLEPANKRASRHPFRWFEWIDKIESEAARRVIQSVISTLIGAAILGTIAFIWAQRDWFTDKPKTILNLLQSPIQLKVWIMLLILLLVAAVFWILYLIRARKLANKAKTVDFIEGVMTEIKICPKTYPKLPFTDEQIAHFGKRNKYVPPDAVDEAVPKQGIEKTLSSASKIKPLKISPLQPKIVRRITGSAYAIDVEISNENQSVSGVRLRILKAEPKLIAYPDVDLDALEFPLIGISDKVLHRGQRCHIHLFDTVFTGAINIHFKSPNKEGDILFTPQKKMGSP